MPHEEQVDLYLVLCHLFEVLYAVYLTAEVDKDLFWYRLWEIDEIIAWSLRRAYRRTAETSSL